MNEERLAYLHDILFGIMCAVDDLCKKHGIEYFLDSGTLLGAVRHKDFIPWDDDVDLTMKRAEYEKFCKVAHELPEPYQFVTPDVHNGYFFDMVPRVIDMRVPLHKETAEDEAQGVYYNRVPVDIFILDEAPASNLAFKKMVFRQKMLYGYAMAHRFDKHKNEHSFTEKLKITALSLPGHMLSLSTIFKKQEKLSQKYRGKGTGYYCMSNAIVKELGLRFEADAFSDTVYLPLRDREFPCPVGYDKNLTLLYGDYMTPPPVEERVPMHADEL